MKRFFVIASIIAGMAPWASVMVAARPDQAVPASATTAGGEKPARTDAPPPRLAVLISLDQFRTDYLDRLDPMFESGFRRLRNDGLWYRKALVDHAPTLSLPGHTTLATGTNPRTHGLAANDWVEKTADGGYTRVVGLFDLNFSILGHPDSRGIAPTRIRVTGLADWFRAADPEARTAAISIGAQAMLYGGRATAVRSSHHVYWMSPADGEFVTSTYYRDRYPPWLEEFNRTVVAESRKQTVWETTVPEKHRRLARRDDARYEGDEVHVSFPHRLADLPDEVTPEIANRWYYDTPLADQALFALARRVVEELSLGRRGATDFLSITVGSTDRIGHDYGPHSQELLDVIHRLDLLLGDFLAFLDTFVGKDGYVVVLSADHGAPNVTEFEVEQGRPSRRIGEEDFAKVLGEVKSLVDGYEGPRDALPDRIAAQLEKADFIVKAMTPRDLSGTGPAEEMVRLYRNSYDPGRPNLYPLWTREVLRGNIDPTHPAIFGIVVELERQANMWSATSTHGSSYDYDREVPLIFMGRGISPGVSDTPARTVDVAPSLARLVGIPFPATVEGKVLERPSERNH